MRRGANAMENRIQDVPAFFRIVVLLFLMASAGCRVGEPEKEQPSGRSGSPWSLSLIAFDEPEIPPTSMTFWAGLTNRGDSARLVCIQMKSIELGEGVSHGEGSGPHACRASDQFALVLQNQTYFIPITVQVERPVSNATRVNVRLSLQDRSASRDDRAREVEVVDELSISAALDRGAQLIRKKVEGGS